MTNDQGRRTRRSRKKKPWRLRWPDDFRDEVLARLLGLNEQRAKEEALVGPLKADKAGKKSRKSKNTAAKPASGQQDLFSDAAEASPNKWK